MRHRFVALSMLLAMLWPLATVAQDTRERGTYQEMRAYVGELFQQKKYAEAAAVLERVLDRFPDNVKANTFNLAAARLLMGDQDKAMQALEEGLRRGVFYSQWDFDGEVMAPLKTHAKFQAFWTHNLEHHAEAQSKAVMKLEVVTPPGYDASKRYPLFVALHGGGENTAVFKPNWVSPRLQAEFIVAYVQSSQVADMTGFHWQDEAVTRRDLQVAYAEAVAKYPVDRARVIVGGFSSGGFASLITAFHQFIPVRGFVALCPEVPASITDAEIAGAAKRGLRGSLLTTELDRRVAAQRALAERWKAFGLDGEFLVTPNIGHWYPKDFAQQLDRAIDRVLPASSGVAAGSRDNRDVRDPAKVRALWLEYVAWTKTVKGSTSPGEWAAKLEREGMDPAEVRRRLEIIRAQFTEQPEGIQMIYDADYGKPLTGDLQKDGFKTTPNAFLVEAAGTIKAGGQALDVGAGMGRNAIHLGTLGWKVTAIDLSAEGLRVLRANAAKSGMTVATVNSSYQDYDFGRSRWDLVAMILSWAPIEDPAFLARVKASIKPGGYLVFEHVLQRTQSPFPPGVHASAPGAVRELFRDFDILVYREVEDYGDWGGPPCGHVRMVARKRR
jgi:2-polyprenyl-3-methyl-5-hydroxy-6-metoxy-1,4-benzoquinol methylase/predicted esterase